MSIGTLVDPQTEELANKYTGLDPDNEVEGQSRIMGADGKGQN